MVSVLLRALTWLAIIALSLGCVALVDRRPPSLVWAALLLVVFLLIAWRWPPKMSGPRIDSWALVCGIAIHQCLWLALLATDQDALNHPLAAGGLALATTTPLVLWLAITRASTASRRLARLRRIAIAATILLTLAEYFRIHLAYADGRYWSGWEISVPLLNRIELPYNWDELLFQKSSLWLFRLALPVSIILLSAYLWLRWRERRSSTATPTAITTD